MEKIGDVEEISSESLFNSRLETGIRALIILNAAYPVAFDLKKMTWFDHLVVHTNDIDGPKSLHPNLPHRNGETLVRRRLIEESITLMRRLNLIISVPTDNGIAYQATEDSYSIVELMRSEYATDLKYRAQWLIENICVLDDEKIHDLIINKLGKWNVEFRDKIMVTE